MYTYLNISIHLDRRTYVYRLALEGTSSLAHAASRPFAPLNYDQYNIIDIERRHLKLDSALNSTKINRRRVARPIIAPIDKFTHRRNEREYKKLWKIVRISQAAGGAGRPRGK